MSVESILEDLENLVDSIAAQSQTELARDPDRVGDSLLKRGLDSLDFIDYLLAIETKYGFRVVEDDIEEHELTSTSNMSMFLHRRLNVGRD